MKRFFFWGADITKLARWSDVVGFRCYFYGFTIPGTQLGFGILLRRRDWRAPS